MARPTWTRLRAATGGDHAFVLEGGEQSMALLGGVGHPVPTCLVGGQDRPGKGPFS